MKTHARSQGRVSTKLNGQHVKFELKQKVVLALNKLADRDTYQIGVVDLEKTAECLTPDMILPFLSCILDTDSEQKSVVRKECIRLMGVLATFHGDLVEPHLCKMVGSIVKRLKDPDSIVRDACVETVGVLAAKLSNHFDESDKVFVLLVKPIFEALGEQNRQVQAGSALCLASIIDNTQDPPISILQRMLLRTTKLLKNPHFMGKSAIIDLNRSIIQAGSALNQNVLSAAIVGIQESLKNNDWTTRKAASVALSEIASGNGSFISSFRASCIRCLESCRFDKVKPVRDTVLQALQYWRNLPGSATPEPSETGSSIKENFCGGAFSDITSASESGRKDISLRKVGTGTVKGRVSQNVRKACQNYMDKSQQSKGDDWHIEIAIPKAQHVSSEDFQNEESEGSSVTKTLDRVNTDNASIQDCGFDYVPMDDKQECSSVSNLVPDCFETKSATVSHDYLEESGNQRFATEEISSQEQIYSCTVRDRRSLESTVTESSCQPVQGCCLQMADEMVCISKQLLGIENRQSNLMDLLQMFTAGVMDSLSTIQSRLLDLEHVVDKLSQVIMHGGKSGLTTSKFVKSQSLTSPRLSTSTPRPSVDIHNRQASLLSKCSSTWDAKVDHNRPSNTSRQGTEMWTNSKFSRNPSDDLQKNCGQRMKNDGASHQQKVDSVFSASSCGNARTNAYETKNSLWERVKSFLCKGDLDSAYMEAIYSGNELVLIELLDRTGPVLESLSPKTVSEILKILMSFLFEQRFTNSIIPWLKQVVDLSTTHGANCLLSSAKARQGFLSAIQEAASTEFSNPAERRCITQLAMRLQNIWGKCS